MPYATTNLSVVIVMLGTGIQATIFYIKGWGKTLSLRYSGFVTNCVLRFAPATLEQN